jgi:hypothetical protein
VKDVYWRELPMLSHGITTALKALHVQGIHQGKKNKEEIYF